MLQWRVCKKQIQTILIFLLKSKLHQVINELRVFHIQRSEDCIGNDWLRVSEDLQALLNVLQIINRCDRVVEILVDLHEIASIASSDFL